VAGDEDRRHQHAARAQFVEHRQPSLPGRLWSMIMHPGWDSSVCHHFLECDYNVSNGVDGSAEAVGWPVLPFCRFGLHISQILTEYLRRGASP
jgi:hypothetical protein